MPDATNPPSLLPASPAPPAPPAPPSAGFLRQRWCGQVPLRTLFWRDMLAVGTAVNLLCSFAALLGTAMGLPLGWAVALHFAPTPWNAFLVRALWRAPAAAAWQRGAALAWFALMLAL